MIKEIIILAGGLGTRLRSAVPDLPKCMAPVAGRPFLYYIIKYFKNHGIEKFIFSLGYKHEIIETYLNTEFSKLDFKCSIEKEPLGTGGAIKLACSKATSTNVLIVNGDTFFAVDLKSVFNTHINNQSDCTLCLKPMQDFSRYGIIMTDTNNKIKSFKEKQYFTEGLINGGIYLLNIESFLQLHLPEKFSFEKEYLEKYCTFKKMYGLVQDKYFIDIGIPEDYERIQNEVENIK
ncbi:MAG: nucleotidyltransferase family protein [Chitinophagaceae bacterium]|nr:nucleotidyltransferase family protein [Chitinophagaceae bacterium]